MRSRWSRSPFLWWVLSLVTPGAAPGQASADRMVFLRANVIDGLSD